MRTRQRVLVTPLDEESPAREAPANAPSGAEAGGTALLSEEALAKDWNRHEEDEDGSTYSRIGSSRTISFFGSVGVEASAGRLARRD